MNFLKSELELYKEYNKDFKADFIEINNGSRLVAGDIFVIYTTKYPIYGVIVSKTDDLNEAVYLTAEPFLASSTACRLKVNHLVSAVKLTHIKFYFDDEFSDKYCEFIKHVDVEEIIENYNILASEVYSGPRKEFFSLESKKIEKLYELFFEKIVYDDSNEVCIEFPEELKRHEKILAADTDGVKGENYVGIIKEKSLIIYLDDSLLGKKINVFYKDRELFNGVVHDYIKITNINGLTKEEIEKNLKISEV
ncbi:MULTISPECIES: hypothetical protein [unclassified Thermosipho (in: thermotogales)]|uniref:hypothetical protein n=1 Tax=unclassified Thermosipho (in: thermotogales) TaxID=2676525 RepID=UPI000985B60F|nr:MULTISPECIES: hypothetical protein [unclassified Thermosipho (in: thermotogales)]MBT1248367.1 hypothetical protein [Thermosipho sp. 1244]OOC47496.1 hypothetical protein XO09_00650 [Thermosipho sp. 1223]